MTEEVLASPRWPKLAAGFRKEGALLLLVAPRASAGLDTLVGATDGAILVGDTPAPEGWPVIAAARPPRPVAPTVSSVVERRQHRSETPAWARRLGIGAAVVALAAVGAVWVGRASSTGGTTVTTDAAGTAVDSEPPAAAAVLPAIPVANPEDSARASAWALEVLLTNAEAEAQRIASQLADSVAGVVVAPMVSAGDAERWYRVVVGAYPTPAEADSALAGMRARGLLAADAGARVSRPFALLLQRDVPREAAPGLLADMAGRGIEGYALDQGDGTARLYAGAYSMPDEAESLAASLRLMGVEPTVVYRTGRAY
ncbi:MAG TPA: SPOR domain-containing protein [Gemmatimonadaceae bacterium]